MSVQFDWDKVLEDSEEIENSVKNFLHEQFQNIHLPPFIQSLSVLSFKLGSSPPELSLRHFSDPFREFYESEEDIASPAAASEGDSRIGTPSPSSIFMPPSTRDGRPVPSFESPSDRQASDPESTGFLSASPPHQLEPADQSLEFGTTPLGNTPQPNHNSPDRTTQNGWSHRMNGTSHDYSEDVGGSFSDVPYEVTEEAKERDFDVQTLVELKYSGDMQLAISATLLVNYPAPSFISLPLAITVTGIEIHTLAVAAYIAPRIHLSILCDVADENEPPNENVDVIRSIKIESEIGDNENHGAVLRNIGKVEKFVLEQLRRVIREEIVWPGWITLEL